MSFLGHLWVSKARGSSPVTHFNTLETLSQLITVCTGGRKGGSGVGRCTDCINANRRKRWAGRCSEGSLLPPQYTLILLVCICRLVTAYSKTDVLCQPQSTCSVSLGEQTSNEGLSPNGQPLRKSLKLTSRLLVSY